VISDNDRRIVFIDDIPTPYRNHLFSYLNTCSDINIYILYLSSIGHEKLWKNDDEKLFPSDYLKSFQLYIKSMDKRVQLSFGVLSKLHHLHPRIIVVGGYHQQGYWMALLYCWLTGTPLVLWSGTTSYSVHSSSFLIDWFKKLFFHQCAAFIAYGNKAAEYLISNNVKKDDILISCNTTDLRKIRLPVKQLLHSQECSIKRDSGKCPTFIFVGRLIESKGVGLLLKALSSLKNTYKFKLIVVGDGPARQSLEQQSLQYGLDGMVHFVGFQQPNDMPRYLVLADCFVFPTLQEVWGLVVNEALAAGLFIISSSKAGVSYDLVKSDEIGMIIDPKQQLDLQAALKYVIEKYDVITSNRALRMEASKDYDIDIICEEMASWLKNQIH